MDTNKDTNVASRSLGSASFLPLSGGSQRGLEEDIAHGWCCRVEASIASGLSATFVWRRMEGVEWAEEVGILVPACRDWWLSEMWGKKAALLPGRKTYYQKRMPQWICASQCSVRGFARYSRIPPINIDRGRDIYPYEDIFHLTWANLVGNKDLTLTHICTRFCYTVSLY